METIAIIRERQRFLNNDMSDIQDDETDDELASFKL